MRLFKTLFTFCLVATIVAAALFIYDIHFAVWSFFCTLIGFGLCALWKIKITV